MEERRGIFVVVEGIDGAGKSTQVDLFCAALERASIPFVRSREPTDGKWGRMIRESAETGRMSPQEELEAFILDRKQHIETLIAPSLEAGKVVILDRYFYSTAAYQGGRGAGTVTEIMHRMKEFAPIPDMVLLLDHDPLSGLDRISQDRGDTPNEFETVSNLTKVRDIFLTLAQSENNFWVFNAAHGINAVHQATMAAFLDYAKNQDKFVTELGVLDIEPSTEVLISAPA